MDLKCFTCILSYITKGQSEMSKLFSCIFYYYFKKDKIIKFTLEFCQGDFRQVSRHSDGGGIRLMKFAIGTARLR